MRGLPRRQVLLTGLLVVLVALAGCSGGNGPGDAETTADTAAADTADEASTPSGETTLTTTADTGSTDGNGTSPATYSYEWTEGESYTFESVADDGTTSTYEWTVTDVRDGNVTAELVVRAGDQERRTTYTGPQGAIFSGTERNRYAFIFAFLQVPPRLTTGQSLSVGNSWTLSSEAFTAGGSSSSTQAVTVDVTGTSTVAGTECYDVTASAANSTETLDACVKRGWPFALSLSISGEESGVSGSVELTSAERP